MGKIITLYHANKEENLAHAEDRPESIPYSSDYHGWLGQGVYFWEDPLRCRQWKSDRFYSAMIEATIDLDDIVDLMSMNPETISFVAAMEKTLCAGKFKTINDRSKQLFQLDADIINRSRVSTLRSGLRGPFYLSGPIASNGNLYKDYHAQIVLWDCSILRKVRLIKDSVSVPGDHSSFQAG